MSLLREDFGSLDSTNSGGSGGNGSASFSFYGNLSITKNGKNNSSDSRDSNISNNSEDSANPKKLSSGGMGRITIPLKNLESRLGERASNIFKDLEGSQISKFEDVKKLINILNSADKNEVGNYFTELCVENVTLKSLGLAKPIKKVRSIGWTIAGGAGSGNAMVRCTWPSVPNLY